MTGTCQVDRPDCLAASADHRYPTTLAAPAAFAPNPSNPMDSEVLPIDQVFRTVEAVEFAEKPNEED
jgi:hypothetical protein